MKSKKQFSVKLTESIRLSQPRSEKDCYICDKPMKEVGVIAYLNQYFKDVEFNYNYFAGPDTVYVFIPDFIALEPSTGSMLFDYRERSFTLYKDMLFDNMVEGEYPIPDQERVRLLNERYFSVSQYPYLPPYIIGGRFAYFITDENVLYVYDLHNDFFIVKFQLP